MVRFTLIILRSVCVCVHAVREEQKSNKDVYSKLTKMKSLNAAETFIFLLVVNLENTGFFFFLSLQP